MIRTGQPAHRVLLVHLRAVPGPAARGELEPGGAPLTGPDGIQPHAAARVEGEAAGLADALRAALEEACVLGGQITGPVRRAVLLVGREGEHDVARRPQALPGPGPYRRQDHRVHVLHVDGPAPPHDPVAHFAGERVHRPVGGLRGDDIQVPVYQHRRRGPVRARDPGHHIGPPGRRLQDPRLDAGVGEPLGDILGRRTLVAVAATPVGRVDPDQVRGEPHHLVHGLPVHVLLVRALLAHALINLVSHIVPPPPPTRPWSPP
jgi:hypothetical protein